jgi:pilus assembly protein Flp/PilA
MSVLQITKSMMRRICRINFEIKTVNILGSARVHRVSGMPVRKILTRIRSKPTVPLKSSLVTQDYVAAGKTTPGVRHMSRVFAYLKDESGATAIEYGLIAAGISVVIIATVNAIGTNLNAKFNSISTQLK